MRLLPKRRLGRTGLSVTEIGLGTYQFTNQFGVPRSEARGILERALETGVNFFDTAPMYGAGESEELVGGALYHHPSKQIYVSTKIGWLDLTIVRFAGDSAYQDEGLLRRVIEHSLHLLRRDFIEMIMIHEYNWPQWGLDRRTGDAPVMRLLESLKRDKIIGAIGMGGKDCGIMADLIETGRFDVVLLTKHFDLAVQDARDLVFPVAEKHDVGVIIGGPFRQGVLAAKDREAIAEIKRTGQFRLGFENEEILRSVEAIYDLSDEVGMGLPEMALRLLLTDPQISTIIPGPRTVAEFNANLEAASKGPLSSDIHERITRIAVRGRSDIGQRGRG